MPEGVDAVLLGRGSRGAGHRRAYNSICHSQSESGPLQARAGAGHRDIAVVRVRAADHDCRPGGRYGDRPSARRNWRWNWATISACSLSRLCEASRLTSLSLTRGRWRRSSPSWVSTCNPRSAGWSCRGNSGRGWWRYRTSGRSRSLPSTGIRRSMCWRPSRNRDAGTRSLCTPATTTTSSSIF